MHLIQRNFDTFCKLEAERKISRANTSANIRLLQRDGYWHICQLISLKKCQYSNAKYMF